MRSQLLNAFVLLTLGSSAQAEHGVSRADVSPQEIQKCQAEWDAWQKSFTSSSPFGAQKKLDVYALGESEFDQVARRNHEKNGKISVRLAEKIPFADASGKVSKIDGFVVDPKDIDRTNREIEAAFNVLRDRDPLITANLAQMIRDNPKGNLLIAVVGSKHALDYFLQDTLPRQVMYGAQGIDQKTERFTPGFRNFVNSLEPRFRPLFLSLALSHLPELETGQVDARAAALEIASRLQMELEQVYRATERVPGIWNGKSLLGEDSKADATVLLVGESHYVMQHKTLENLPSTKCLKILGFSSVTYAHEGLPRLEKGYAPQFVASVSQLGAIGDGTRFLVGPKEFSYNELLEKFAPEAARIKARASIEFTTSAYITSSAMKQKKDGMPIYLTGLESDGGEDFTGAKASTDMVRDLREWIKVHDRVQQVRRNLLSSGSTAFSQELSALWTQQKQIEDKLAKYRVLPLKPEGKTANPVTNVIRLQ